MQWNNIKRINDNNDFLSREKEKEFFYKQKHKKSDKIYAFFLFCVAVCAAVLSCRSLKFN